MRTIQSELQRAALKMSLRADDGSKEIVEAAQKIQEVIDTIQKRKDLIHLIDRKRCVRDMDRWIAFLRSSVHVEPDPEPFAVAL